MKLPEAPLSTFPPISSSIHCQWSRGEVANLHCHQHCSHASFQWNVCKSNDQPSSSPSPMVTGHWQANVRSAICRFHSSVKFMLPFQFSCQILLTAAHWDKYRYRLENKYLISFGTLSLVFNSSWFPLYPANFFKLQLWCLRLSYSEAWAPWVPWWDKYREYWCNCANTGFPNDVYEISAFPGCS